MELKIYGRKGNPVKTSDAYDCSTILQTYIKRDGQPYRELLASGIWNKEYFRLQKDSCIRKKFEGKSNIGGFAVIEKLLLDNVFIDADADPNYYILNRDIGLHSPSAAANLVHGNDRNGRECWEHDGSLFQELNDF